MSLVLCHDVCTSDTGVVEVGRGVMKEKRCDYHQKCEDTHRAVRLHNYYYHSQRMSIAYTVIETTDMR